MVVWLHSLQREVELEIGEVVSLLAALHKVTPRVRIGSGEQIAGVKTASRLGRA